MLLRNGGHVLFPDSTEKRAADRYNCRVPRFTRRQFTRRLAQLGVGLLPNYRNANQILANCSFWGAGKDQFPAPPLFEEVPPSASHITFQHVNGRSADYYLPETTGAGCAFLDYDNDGWMDIYLVNSGKCDFYDPKPPLRNALYRNNRDGTFTDVTEKAGVLGGGYGMGVGVGVYK